MNKEQSSDINTPNTSDLPSPWRCLFGAIVSAVLSSMMYSLTVRIATVFATKPVTTSSTVAMNIGIATRTLVTGIIALGAGIFGIIAIGLTALAIQIIWRKQTGKLSN
jgi:hypothetical protein